LTERHAEAAKTPQLFAANVETLFIVTSCNADFNPARMERYLALANQAGTNQVRPTDDAKAYQQKAAILQRDLAVVTSGSRHIGAFEPKADEPR
jgi:ribosome biogenesis GTPase / thiamine phosphate phosphatase